MLFVGRRRQHEAEGLVADVGRREDGLAGCSVGKHNNTNKEIVGLLTMIISMNTIISITNLCIYNYI